MIVSIEDEAAEAAEVVNLMARQNSQAAASANVAAAAAVRNGYGYEVIWVVVFSRERYKITVFSNLITKLDLSGLVLSINDPNC